MQEHTPGTINRDPDPRKDLGGRGSEHSLRGMLNRIGGQLQETMGRLTGSRRTQAGGEEREAKGAMQGEAGEQERRLDDRLDQG